MFKAKENTRTLFYNIEKANIIQECFNLIKEKFWPEAVLDTEDNWGFISKNQASEDLSNKIGITDETINDVLMFVFYKTDCLELMITMSKDNDKMFNVIEKDTCAGVDFIMPEHIMNKFHPIKK